MRTPRAAIRRGARLLGGRLAEQEGFIGVGVGVKHRSGRYARGSEPCIKVHVRRKREDIRPRVPSWLRVEHRGQTYRIATDVEEVSGLRLHSLECAPSAALSRSGTVFAFADLDDGDRLAFTAGHVADKVSADADMSIARQSSGRLVGAGTLIAEDDGVLDIATVRLRSGVDDLSQGLPWRGLRDVVATAQLWRAFEPASDGPPRALVFGAEGTTLAVLDTLLYTPVRFRHSSSMHAAPLLFYRAETGHFGGGFSGAAVTNGSADRLLGIHVGGNRRVGYAQSAAAVLFGVEQAIEERVRVV